MQIPIGSNAIGPRRQEHNIGYVTKFSWFLQVIDLRVNMKVIVKSVCVPDKLHKNP